MFGRVFTFSNHMTFFLYPVGRGFFLFPNLYFFIASVSKVYSPTEKGGGQIFLLEVVVVADVEQE